MIPLDMAERTRPPDGRPSARQPAWRQDFPIDLPQDQYLAQRFTLPHAGQCGVRRRPGRRRRLEPAARRRGPSPTQAIARVDEIPVGSARPFQYAGASGPCLLLRPDERTFLAFGQKCTHLGCGDAGRGRPAAALPLPRGPVRRGDGPAAVGAAAAGAAARRPGNAQRRRSRRRNGRTHRILAGKGFNHATNPHPRPADDDPQRDLVPGADSRGAATVAADGHGECVFGRGRGGRLAGRRRQPRFARA